jgi:CBS domain-containing protein
MMNEYLSSIMDTDVETLAPEDSLADARKLLLQKGLHHVPILVGRKLVGIITTWDLFKMEKSPTEYGQMRCGDAMSTHLACLEPDAHIGAAAEVFLEHLFQAIPIVDDDHNFLGMVTSYEVIKYEFKREYPAEAERYA